MLEAFEQPHATAGDEPAVQSVAEGVDVKQRQREKQAVAIVDLPAGKQIEGIGGEIIVRENRAFRDSGGAGSVDQRGGRIAIERGINDRLITKLGQVGRGDEQLGLGVVHDMGDFAVAIEDVDRDENHAQLHAREIEVDHRQTVGELHADAVALREALMDESGGHAVAPAIQFTEGVLPTLPFECHFIAAIDQRQVKEIAQIHSGKGCPLVSTTKGSKRRETYL